MSQTTSIVLLPQTDQALLNVSTVTGEKQPAAGYYKGSSDNQTITWNLSNVTGRIIIQATLVENPSGADWFPIHTIEAGPRLTEVGYVNLRGNYVWIRAQVNLFTSGIIRNIRINY